jgi:spore coat protein CotH
MRLFAVLGSLLLLSAVEARADKADAFFDDTKVQELRLYFDFANWYSTLYQGHSSTSDPYYPARMTWGSVTVSNIGARFKGNSSFRREGVKKPFKLDFNYYNSATTFVGLKKLNLQNGDLQPDLLREKIFYDFAAKYIPANRAVHVRLYVNDVLWGLYVAVEQPDKTMMEDRFGSNEDGNLFEAGESDANVTWLGAAASAYQRYFTLSTNETANDWTDFINLANLLNNTPAATLPSKIEPVLDVENILYGMALNNLFVNLDSYLGSGSEFFLYDRSDTGQFVHIHTDLNENFGTTGDGSPKIAVPASLSPFYVPTTGTKPLVEKLWAVDSYKRWYLRMLARMLREGFDATTMQTKITRLANLIRADVQADPNKLFTAAQFETSLTSQITSGGTTILGLKQFVTDRYAYLRAQLNTYAAATDVRLNEIMTAGASTFKDGAGDADPWVELYNPGPGTVNLSGLYLTDDASVPTKWAAPTGTLADGAFKVIWLDNESAEGSDHATFRPNAAGGNLYLYYRSGSTTTLVDSVAYPATGGYSLFRSGDMGSQWLLTP